MNLKCLLNNFDLQDDVGEQDKNLFKRRKYIMAVLYAVLWFILSCGKTIWGQTTYTSPRLLEALNNRGGSARATALGSAFVGVADDPSAILWNPAGLGTIAQGGLGLHHDSWLVGTSQETLITAIPIGAFGGIGAMVDYTDFGTFQGRDPIGTLTAPYSVANFELMLGWGKELFHGFSTGFAIQETHEMGQDQSYDIFSGNIGVLYSLNDHLKFGLSVVNLGGTQLNALEAAAIEGGASFQLEMDQLHSLLLALSGTWEPQAVNRLGVGAEYTFQSRYFLRAGYTLADQRSGFEGFQGFTAGAGIRFNDFQLDYSYLPYGDLGTSHRISLSYFFPSLRRAKETAQAIVRPSNTGTPAGSFKPSEGLQAGQKTLTLQFDIPPEDPVSQGRALDAQNQLLEAMKLYENALIQNQKDMAAWYYLGSDYNKLGQKNNAIQCFEQVLQLDPNNKTLASWLEQYKLKP